VHRGRTRTAPLHPRGAEAVRRTRNMHGTSAIHPALSESLLGL